MESYVRRIIAGDIDLTGFFGAQIENLKADIAEGRLAPEAAEKTLKQLEEAVKSPNNVKVDGLVSDGVPYIIRRSANIRSYVFTVESSEKVTAEQVEDCMLDLVEDLSIYDCNINILRATRR